jgi:putative transposase
VLDVPRSSVQVPPREKKSARGRDLVDEDLARTILCLVKRFPTFGYRRIWALLCKGQGLRVNKKKVYRIMKLKGWLVHQRGASPRPRVSGRRSIAAASNERWAMDITHVHCGGDG